ncbi:hypothetical protein CLOSTMETH_02078 [[Clostridium] methylpentosum DSM 5476]|uniref:Uncharacterized protein n=1 Tax=[Clostridium] methylpentosum DSM 5476 TaxID=537013 RepID=C0EE00_9FIRM|nr:hypothetical protein CLOSTMETH_02078 [[Clostridium] methylpentosum DSM 5476]
MCNLIISFLFRKQSFYAYYDTKKSICLDYFCLTLVIFCEIHPFFIYQFVFFKKCPIRICFRQQNTALEKLCRKVAGLGD